jgi:phage head maturation protease
LPPPEPFYASIPRNLTLAVDDSTPEAPITVTAFALPWAAIVDLNLWGDTVEFAAGSIAAPDAGRVPFLADHDNHPFGYGVAFVDDGAGLVATMAVPRDELADERTAAVVRQMRNGVRTAVSVGVALDEITKTDKGDHDHYVVNRGRLLELSSVVVPRFDDARVQSIAASARSLPVSLSTITPTEPDDPQPDEPEPEVTATADRHPANLVPYRGRGVSRDASLLSIAASIAAAGRQGNVQGVNQVLREMTAAWTDVTTTAVTGLVQPQWVSEVLGLVEFGRPLCSAFRQGTITSSPVKFPHWADLPDVGPQATQKTEIASGPATIDTMDFPVQTYAGGNDVARQVIDWSTPDFVLEYFRAATEVWSRQCEAFYLGTLLSVAGNTIAMGGATPPSFVDVIGAAIGISASAGVGGRIVFACSGDVYGGLWSTLATLTGSLFSAVNGGFPVPNVVVAPNAAPGTLLIGPSNAAVSFTSAGAPVRLQALDVPRGGVDLAVWGYFAGGALYPDALTNVTGYVPPVVPTSTARAERATKAAK